SAISSFHLFSVTTRPPPRSTLFPYTTLFRSHNLPVYTHVYETRGQALIAREQFADHDGSLIRYIENNGLLGPQLNIVHSVWITRSEEHTSELQYVSISYAVFCLKKKRPPTRR